MDTEKSDVFITNNKKSESLLTSENKEEDSNGTNTEVKCNKDEIIESFIEQVRKRHFLMNKNKSLQQRLAIYISGSSEKDYFLKLNFSEEADEWAFRKLLDSTTFKEDESQDASNKSLVEIESIKEEINQKKESFMELKTSFKEATEKAALNSVNSETGNRFSIKDVKELLTREEEVSKTLQEYQLYSIQKRHNLNLAMEKKKNLAEGPLDFAEYEMMCIETQNNKEIIQPISEMRDLLSEEKMKYTRMKHESKELQHKFILLQYPRLIEDYNAVQQKNEEAYKELQRLKSIYEEEIKILNKKFTHEL